jgi:hypothetical protein
MATKCTWRKTKKDGLSLATKNGTCKIKATGDTTFSGTTEYKAICHRGPALEGRVVAVGALSWVKSFGCHHLTWLK